MYEKKVKLPFDGWSVEGDLVLPVKAKSIIIFSGAACRYDPQSNMMARYLQRAGFGTLLFNLMTSQEAEHFNQRLDIDLVTQRLLSFTLWVRSHSEYHDLDLGYFGYHIGAAAALRAAGEIESAIKAVVTESARTDLAMDLIPKIISPTLLIVGELDFQILKLNRKALDKLRCDKQLVVIPGASHSLEEPGKLKMAGKDAVSWFTKYLPAGGVDHEIVYDIPEPEHD